MSVSPRLLTAGLSVGGLLVVSSVIAADVAPATGATAPESPYPGLPKLLEYSHQAQAVVAEASEEGELALTRMQVEAPLKISLWAAEPMLANPVAFTFDEKGRLFVAETHRYRSSVLDIRDFIAPMLEQDLATRNLDDRQKVIDRVLGPEGRKTLSIESERIRLVEDRNGDGKADFSSVYAEGFNDPLDGIASGVLVRNDRVWFTNIPSVWLLEGTNGAGQAVKRTELSRGYGIRFNYTGHDLHGLIFGPDGKLYFSVGDRGSHITTKEGGVIDLPDTGAVFRMDADGSNLEVVADGLRNPQELAFDEHGNLWTGDNDSDQGDMERLVQVVEGGDSGWRIGYQFAPLGNAGPWNREKLWIPRFPEQAAYLLPPISNVEDGPSGIAYHPGTGLNAKYRGHLFMTHFKGTSARSGIQTYTMDPKGASFVVRTSEPFVSFALPTDVEFGADGKLYFSDWDEGWPKSAKGRIYVVEDPTQANDPLIRETQRLLREGMAGKPEATLVPLVGHADQRVRLEAQWELAGRGASSTAAFARVATSTASAPLARLHAVWGLGQIARNAPDAVAVLPGLLRDPDPEVRAQAAKVLGDARVASAYEGLIAALGDPAARVRFFAAQSLGKLRRPEATSALLELLRANRDEDLYLRHAGVMGLVGSANLPELEKGSASSDRSVRLGVLLAYRRLGRAEIARFLSDSDPLIVREAARAINDAPIPAAMPALAAHLERAGSDELVGLRAINAHFRIGGAPNAQSLARFAQADGAPASLRAEAITQLALWSAAPDRDRIVGVYRPHAASRDAAAGVAALKPALESLLMKGPEEVQVAALDAIEKLRLTDAGPLLLAIVKDAAHSPAVRTAALRQLDRFKDSRLAEAVREANGSGNEELNLAALPIAARISPEQARPVIETLLGGTNVRGLKAAYSSLGTLKGAWAAERLVSELDRLDRGEIVAGARLELVEAAEERTEQTVKDRLARRDEAIRTSADPMAKYALSLDGGNRSRGQQLYRNHPMLACMRCHKVLGEGGDVGPDLSMIGRTRSRAYLLEAVVHPSATFPRGFASAILTMKDGSTKLGTVDDEDDTTLTLKVSDGQLQKIAKADIAARETPPSSMPAIYGDVLKPGELRDLVEYLASLQTGAVATPPRAVHGN